MDSHSKRRIQLILIALVFISPVWVSMFLNFSGWRPSHTRNFGELVEPPQDVNAVRIRLVDNTLFNWRSNSNDQWTLLAFSGSSCETQCLTLLDSLQRARITLNKNMQRLRIVYVGTPLSAEVVQQLPSVLFGKLEEESRLFSAPTQADNLSAALVDPAGLLMMRYPVGFDPNGLRKDIARLIR